MDGDILVLDYPSSVSDGNIHKFAVVYLLSQYKSELILTRGNYAYRVKGGREDGHLYYSKGSHEWVLVANWCFYGLYIVIRYKKAVWLRPMYENLFSRMRFRSVTFDEYSIELLGSEGEILRNRRFRLSPPKAIEKVMFEKFGFTEEQIRLLKKETGLT